jgi:hypothetical protein
VSKSGSRGVQQVLVGSRRNREKLFHCGVISEGISSDAHRQLREDWVEEERPWLRALVNSVFGPISDTIR